MVKMTVLEGNKTNIVGDICFFKYSKYQFANQFSVFCIFTYQSFTFYNLNQTILNFHIAVNVIQYYSAFHIVFGELLARKMSKYIGRKLGEIGIIFTLREGDSVERICLRGARTRAQRTVTNLQRAQFVNPQEVSF